MKSKRQIISSIILFLFLVLLIVGFVYGPQWMEGHSLEDIRGWVLGFGFLAFAIYILLVTIGVPFNLPTVPLIFLGGFIFGTTVGFFIALIGMILGSTFAFYITRLTGRPLLEALVSKHHINHFSKIFKKRGTTAVLISYTIPVFPTDTLSLFLGLTKMKYHKFLSLVILGRIPRVLMIILLGADLYSGFSIRTLFVALIGTVFVLIAIFRERIKRALFSELRVIKKEVGILESWFGITR